MAENALFTVGQKAFIIQNKHVLILTNERYGIDFPGGRIQEGETDVITALKREVIEETGLEIEVGVPYHTWYFETQTGDKIFTVGYICTPLTTEITISEEHEAHDWVNKHTFEEVCKRIGKYDADTEILRKLFSDPDLFQ